MRRINLPPGVETLGQNLRAFTDNLMHDESFHVAQKYGLVDLNPNEWYPAQSLLDFLYELLNSPNSSPNMVAIGMEIGKIVPMPPEMSDPKLGDALMVWDSLYQYLHRGGDVGKIMCQKVDNKHYKLLLTDIYPDDFSYGIIYGYARRFLPRGTKFTVYYDENTVCRDKGGNGPTIIHVSWE